MKTHNIIISLILIAVVGLVLAAHQPSLAEGTRVLTVEDIDWPPYFFAGKPDSPKGIAKELLEMCLSETEYPYEFTSLPLKRMLVYLEQGKLHLGALSYRKEREAFAIYGKEPLFSSGYMPIVRAERPIQITSIQDFDNLRLGHFAGLPYSEEFRNYVEKREAEGSLVTTVTTDSLMDMLLADRIDVFVRSKETALWEAKQKNILDKIKVLDFEIRKKDYFVILSKKSNVQDKTALLNTIDRCIRATKKDGRYADVLKKYGIE